MNIYEKLHKIMGEVKKLQKDGKAEFGSTKYKYLSEEKTTEVFREKLVENKLLILTIRATETKDDKVTHGIYTYRIINVECPDEFIDVMSTGQGHDSTDKGSGKASTYAYKYLMWRTFALPSGDDPDKITGTEIESSMRTLDEVDQEKKQFKELERKLYDLYNKIGVDFTEVPQRYHDKAKVTLSKSTTEQLGKFVKDLEKYVEKRATTKSPKLSEI